MIIQQQNNNSKICITIRLTVIATTELSHLWVADSPMSYSWAYAILPTILWTLNKNNKKKLTMKHKNRA